jgi:hypothetical protein
MRIKDTCHHPTSYVFECRRTTQRNPSKENGIYDGNAPIALQIQRNKCVKISKANVRRIMVSNATIIRETSADDTIRHANISTLKKLGLKKAKGN